MLTRRSTSTGKRSCSQRAAAHSRIHGVKRSYHVRFAGRFEEKAAQLFNIISRGDSDWEAGLQSHDARGLPAAQHCPFESVVLRDRQLPDIAEHEAMPRVVQGRT